MRLRGAVSCLPGFTSQLFSMTMPCLAVVVHIAVSTKLYRYFQYCCSSYSHETMLFETAKFVVVQPKRFFNVFFGLIGTDLADI